MKRLGLAAAGALILLLLAPSAHALSGGPASPGYAAADRELTLLTVGDSLTHATLYPNEWARLLSLPGNPKWTMLGTHKPAGALPTVAHEGYGGWAWATFLTKFARKAFRSAYRSTAQ